MTIVVKLSPELEEILRDRAHDRGEDVDVVASELLAQVLLADNQGARELEMLLERFENQYQMDSRSFYQKFQSGAIGDSADFFEWNAYYEMLNAS
jgi:hypothetical protein